jgi:hypothetical protein
LGQSQLSEATRLHPSKTLVRAQGIEPWAYRLKAGCSDLLS